MPIFEYKCLSCGKIEEVLVKSGPGKSPACPDCGKSMEKQFSSFSAVVKEPPRPAGGCHGCSNTGCPKFGG
ncbi:MAG TPA: zinc ribbon domain-containing protein [Anaerohalosphaeraceae bacterium]|nr:zinc ribbon domain-containing protein [Anaerohalosphaeraceae bacterium]